MLARLRRLACTLRRLPEYPQRGAVVGVDLQQAPVQFHRPRAGLLRVQGVLAGGVGGQHFRALRVQFVSAGVSVAGAGAVALHAARKAGADPGTWIVRRGQDALLDAGDHGRDAGRRGHTGLGGVRVALQQRQVVRRQLRRAVVGTPRVGRAAEHDIGATQAPPAFRITAVLGQTRFEPRHHGRRIDRRRGGIRSRLRGIELLPERTLQIAIQPHGRGRQQDEYRQRERPHRAAGP